MDAPPVRVNGFCVPHHAFLGVGANLDPESNILRGLTKVQQVLPILEMSRFYRTFPIGLSSEPLFINGVVHVLSSYEPRTLKYSVLRSIEQGFGRKRTGDKFAPRPLDLDLLLYDDYSINEEGLNVPSPEITHYPFLAIPLAELLPDFRLPGELRSLQEIASQIDASGMIYLEEFTRDLHGHLGLSLRGSK